MTSLPVNSLDFDCPVCKAVIGQSCKTFPKGDGFCFFRSLLADKKRATEIAEMNSGYREQLNKYRIPYDR
jgi:hypothetical protein